MLFLGNGCHSNPDVRSAPSEGIIVFSDPVSHTGVTGRASRPVRLVFLSIGVNDSESGAGVITETGRIEYLGAERRRVPATRRTQDETLADTQWASGRPVYLSAERFQELWASLASVGLFDLPLYPGQRAPSDQSYFLLDDTRSKRIVVEPKLGRLDRLSEKERNQLKAWREAKHILLYAGS